MACNEKLRQIAREEVGDNLCGEIAPFTFTSSSGAIELKGAPHIYMPNIIFHLTYVQVVEAIWDRTAHLGV